MNDGLLSKALESKPSFQASKPQQARIFTHSNQMRRPAAVLPGNRAGTALLLLKPGDSLFNESVSRKQY